MFLLVVFFCISEQHLNALHWWKFSEPIKPRLKLEATTVCAEYVKILDEQRFTSHPPIGTVCFQLLICLFYCLIKIPIVQFPDRFKKESTVCVHFHLWCVNGLTLLEGFALCAVLLAACCCVCFQFIEVHILPLLFSYMLTHTHKHTHACPCLQMTYPLIPTAVLLFLLSRILMHTFAKVWFRLDTTEDISTYGCLSNVLQISGSFFCLNSLTQFKVLAKMTTCVHWKNNILNWL